MFKHYASWLETEAEAAQNAVFNGDLTDIGSILLREQKVGEARGLCRLEVKMLSDIKQLKEKVKQNENTVDTKES